MFQPFIWNQGVSQGPCELKPEIAYELIDTLLTASYSVQASQLNKLLCFKAVFSVV